MDLDAIQAVAVDYQQKIIYFNVMISEFISIQEVIEMKSKEIKSMLFVINSKENECWPQVCEIFNKKNFIINENSFALSSDFPSNNGVSFDDLIEIFKEKTGISIAEELSGYRLIEWNCSVLLQEILKNLKHLQNLFNEIEKELRKAVVKIKELHCIYSIMDIENLDITREKYPVIAEILVQAYNKYCKAKYIADIFNDNVTKSRDEKEKLHIKAMVMQRKLWYLCYL